MPSRQPRRSINVDDLTDEEIAQLASKVRYGLAAMTLVIAYVNFGLFSISQEIRAAPANMAAAMFLRWCALFLGWMIWFSCYRGDPGNPDRPGIVTLVMCWSAAMAAFWVGWHQRPRWILLALLLLVAVEQTLLYCLMHRPNNVADPRSGLRSGFAHVARSVIETGVGGGLGYGTALTILVWLAREG